MNEEAIKLLDGVIHHYTCRVCGKYCGNANSPSKHWTDCPIDKALTLLKQPKCKTCGDTGQIYRDICSEFCPCPDCQQPVAGVFTELWREKLENAVALYKVGKIPDDWFQSIVTGFREACDRLDTSEAKLKDLLKVCKDILPALKKIKKTRQIDPFYLDTLIAILDNAIAKVLKQSDIRPPVEGDTDNPDPLPSKKVGE